MLYAAVHNKEKTRNEHGIGKMRNRHNTKKTSNGHDEKRTRDVYRTHNTPTFFNPNPSHL